MNKTRVNTIKERLFATTPGSWNFAYNHKTYEEGDLFAQGIDEHGEVSMHKVISAHDGYVIINEEDAEFIVNAKRDMANLIELYEEKCKQLDETEVKWLHAASYNESLQHVNEFNNKSKKKLIADQNLIMNDRNYLIATLESIRRICTPGQKQNSDLDKILELANEALEEVE